MPKVGRSRGRIPYYVVPDEHGQRDVPGAKIAHMGLEHQKNSGHIRLESPLLAVAIPKIIEASLRSTPCWKALEIVHTFLFGIKVTRGPRGFHPTNMSLAARSPELSFGPYFADPTGFKGG